MRSLLLAALALTTACTVQQTDVPSLTGPSEYALSITITATPDSISQDGASQSAIVVFARGPNGAPITAVPLRLDMSVGGVLQDFGTLSARSIVTGSDGRAAAVYTAPAAPPPSAGGSGNLVTIVATATGSNFQAANPQNVDIRLVPPGVILPPAQTPTPSFTFSPSPVLVNLPINFDASRSCAGSSPCSSTAGITSFQWSFGDGTTASGQTATKTFTGSGAFNVTLTVTNDRGVSASTTQAVSVGAGTAPTASFVFSPASPQVLQVVQFNAEASRAAAGRTITRYAWDFGDGVTKTGITSTHDFDAAGAYTVVLSVTDDLGQTGVTSTTVTVVAAGGGGTPTASFTFSPAQPGVGDTIFFNASTSSGGGRPITTYSWTFGDGTIAFGVTTRHAYTTAGAYSVQLTVTNDIGQTATSAAQAITVGSPPAPTSNFTFSPTAPFVGQQVVFDASTSTTAQGQTIVDVAWNFGDGTAVVHCGGILFPNDPSCVNVSSTNRISAHTYASAQTFTVNLVVTDSAGRTGAKAATVTVATANPTATLAIIKTGGMSIQADGSASTAVGSATISTYAFNWGDGSPTTSGTAAVVSHTYPALVPPATTSTFTVRLTVTDSAGRTGTTTQSVTVP